MLTRSDYSALVAAQASRSLLSFSTTLTVLVAIALIVGAFIIFNAFSLVVAQRRRELALLRCLGASRAQLALVVTGEAAAVGLIASVAGGGPRTGVRPSVLRNLVQRSGTVLPTGPLQLHWTSALICLAAGTGVAVLASDRPGRAGRLGYLRSWPCARTRWPKAQLAHPARRRLAAVGGHRWGRAGDRRVDRWPTRRSGRRCRAPGARNRRSGPGGGGILGRRPGLADGQGVGLHRCPGPSERRPASGEDGGVGAAVVVGVALICALAVIASSARASSNDELSRTVLADYVLTAAGAGPSGGGPGVVPPMAPGVVARLRAEPGAGGGLTLLLSDLFGGRSWIRLGRHHRPVLLPRVVGLGPLQGSLAGLRAGGVAIEKSLAQAPVAGTWARFCHSPSSPRTAARK